MSIIEILVLTIWLLLCLGVGLAKAERKYVDKHFKTIFMRDLK